MKIIKLGTAVTKLWINALNVIDDYVVNFHIGWEEFDTLSGY